MIEDFYIQCTRKRPTKTYDAKAEPIETLQSTAINGYKCTQSFIRQVTAGKQVYKAQYKFLTDDFDIKFGDIINYEGIDYQVVSDTENTSHLNHHALVYIEKFSNVTR
jgi:hypothetical protein